MPLLRKRVNKAFSQTCTRAHRLFGRSFGLFVLLTWTVLCIVGVWSSYRPSLPRQREIRAYGAHLDASACIAWRRTDHCTPFGVRITSEDRDCQAWISQGPGYCECSAGRTVKRLKCGRHAAFRCWEECQALNLSPAGLLQLPPNISCGPGTQRGRETQKILAAVELIDSEAYAAVASSLWGNIEGALHLAGGSLPQLPEIRSEGQDWVRDGLKLPREDVQLAQAQWQRFMMEAPEYPHGFFKGKGIAILAGGPQYMVPAWVNVQMLRAAGCQLPVEMLFPEAEFPTPQVEAALKALGVTSRALPRTLGAHLALRREPNQHATLETTLSGFTLKVAAVILCSFREVIFLDSDNVPAQSPNFLFNTPQYKEHGALLWPDYWASSVAPDLRSILGVQSLPEGTTESGQMVFDKARVWEALMLAAYFNMQSSFYYELFSNFMGKGDKESFAIAFSATGTPFHKVSHPVGSLGLMRQYCSPDQVFCWEEFVGNTMTQYSPGGELLFLHTNLSPKWNLQLPGDFKAYTRRWQVSAPGMLSFSEVAADWERDIEHDIWQSLVAFRCQDFFASSVTVAVEAEHQVAPALGLHGFHPMNEGVNFRQAYRWGLTGVYQRFTQTDFGDCLQHFKNTKLKPVASWFRRAALRLIGRERYFHLL